MLAKVQEVDITGDEPSSEDVPLKERNIEDVGGDVVVLGLDERVGG